MEFSWLKYEEISFPLSVHVTRYQPLVDSGLGDIQLIGHIDLPATHAITYDCMHACLMK